MVGPFEASVPSGEGGRADGGGAPEGRRPSKGGGPSDETEGIERVFDILLERHRRAPQTTMLASRSEDDGASGDGRGSGDAGRSEGPGGAEARWRRLSVADVLSRVNAVSAGLLELDVENGDRIGILSSNRPEWHIVDFATQQIGAVTVPLFPKMSDESYRHIVDQADPAVVFVESEALLDELGAALEGERGRPSVFLFEPTGASAGAERGSDGAGVDAKPWTDLHATPDDEVLERIEGRRQAVSEEDLATIVYTSGTTGTPKGVVLSHHNLVSNIGEALKLAPVEEGQRALSFLPLSHVFERMLCYMYMTRGLGIHYAREIDTLGEDMRDVAPHVFTTVPRLLEKVWERIEAEGEELEGWKARLFDWAVGVADDYELQGKGPWYRLKLAAARKLVLGRWKGGVGGEIVVIISGGAALSADLNRRLTAAGIDILEGYGLTETSPVLTVNRYERSERKFGSVGKPLDNVEIRIADDGEIRCKGPSVTEGYLDDPEATEAAFDDDGWFRTGDLGSIDDDGFLWVEGRKKSVFKTSGGKYVDPTEVENRLTDHRLIEHAMLVGEERKMVTALIQPAWDNLEKWASDDGLDADSREDLVETDAVRERFEEVVEDANRDVDETAQVKKFELVPDEWSPASGELTATMKLRRSSILERYGELIEGMYEE